MSRARLVITAVVHEKRRQAEVARAYGVSEGWVSKLVARYRDEGEVAVSSRGLDDCAGYALGVTAHRRVSGPIVAAAFRETVALHGIPASTLTDIQSGCAALGLPRRPASQDRCRPAPARRRCLTDRSARRLLAS